MKYAVVFSFSSIDATVIAQKSGMAFKLWPSYEMSYVSCMSWELKEAQRIREELIKLGADKESLRLEYASDYHNAPRWKTLQVSLNP